jgi:type I restriction enzyme, S subunit
MVDAQGCSGQLTADWRESNAPTQIDMHDLSEVLPERWKKLPLIDVAQKVQDGNYGASYPKAHEWKSEGVAFLTPSAIACDGGIDTNEIKYISIERNAVLTKAQLLPDDVIFPNRGSREAQRYGREPFAIVIPLALFPANINPQLTLVRPDRTKILRDYLCHAMNSHDFLSQVRELTGGSALTFINLTQTKQLTIPVPPLEVQSIINQRVGSLFAVADKIETRLQAATARVEKITQAILAKAFRGELVPSEAELARQEGRDYEPASVLLDRIRAQRAAESNDAPTRRRTKLSRNIKPSPNGSPNSQDESRNKKRPKR